MKKSLSMLLAIMLLAILPASAKVTHLLPTPHQITQQSGTFALNRQVTITYNGTESCELLEEVFRTNGCTIGNSGAQVTVTIVNEIADAYDYKLEGFENEAYTLNVTTDAINITAITPTGVIRAAQTLAQLAEGYAKGSEAIEAVSITDWASFKLRGYMHDVGRSFISVAELKKHIELLSRFKVNCFHWHFTENQAWRLEIEKYPALTSAESMTRFAGSFYTQDECREVAAIAKKHGVVIIPEIDMPGHSEAFERAMHFDMQTNEGVAVLKDVLTEVAALFPDAPYIHIGADEKEITYTDANGKGFLAIMVDHIHDVLKRKVVVWNPIRDVNVANSGADMTQMWSSSGTKIAGKANIDCRYNYTNHFDVFADVVGIYRSNIYYVEQGNAEVAGTISAYWNDRKTPTETDIIKQNNMYANVIASAERGWIGGGKLYIEKGGTTLPNSGEEYDEFADWERRFLFHKANSLKNEPIPYVKQTNVRWRITDPFPNNGNSATTFSPETDGLSATADMQESYEHNGSTYYTGMATGAGIYLRHTWGNNIIPTYYGTTNYSNMTSYAWTYVYSETEQTVGAQIEFQNYGRSENDKAPDAGKWDRKGSDIWLNGERIAPPAWDNSGKGINSEVDLMNENFSARKPVEVTLKAGWNKVFIKLPYVGANGVRLNKWMFTFVLTDLEGKDAVEGLIYSSNKCMDVAAESVAAKISEIKRDKAACIGTAVGLWDASLAETLDATVAQIEATISETASAEDRAAQITTLSDAWTTFASSLTADNMNKPVSGNLYRMCTPLRDNRYATGNGADAAITGPTEATTKASVWQFVTRTDGTYNIINLADGTYISPASNNNAELKTVAAEPANGWSIKPAATKGYVTVTSNSVQFNQQNHTNYYLLNWGSGTNTDDTGCQYLFTDVTDITPASPIATLNNLDVENYPYELSGDLAASIMAKENITIAINVTMPSSFTNDQRYALVCGADPTRAATGATKTNSPYIAYGLNGTYPAYLASSRGGDKFSYRPSSVSASTNYKIVYVIDVTNQKNYVYVNGELKTTASYPNGGYELQSFSHLASNENAKIFIGAGKVNNNSYDAFGGQIHSVLFYDKALTANEVSLIEYPKTSAQIAIENAATANSNLDIYGLQRYYGLVQNAGTGIEGNGQIFCNHPAATSQESGNAYANLIDGVYSTFFHSGYGSTEGSEAHYLQATLSRSVKSFRFYLKKRHNNDVNRPTKITIEGSTDGNSWEDVTTIASGFPTQAAVLDYYSEAITLAKPYKHLRFTVNSTSSGSRYFTASEFYILPNNSNVAKTFDAVRAYRNASKVTAEIANALLAAYAWNNGLTNAMPIDGYNHFVYADTKQSDGTYVARYLYNNNGTLATSTENSATDSYIWKATLDEDGYYTFENAAQSGKYIGYGNSGNGLTVNTTPVQLDIKSNYAVHTGSVGIMRIGSDDAGKYMVTKADGSSFNRNSGKVNDGSWCSDYVFIPADIYTGKTLRIVSNIPCVEAQYSWNNNIFTAETILEDADIVANATLSTVSNNATYKFDGFYRDADYSTLLGETVEINELTADRTVYAKFSLDIFSASFEEGIPVEIRNYREKGYVVTLNTPVANTNVNTGEKGYNKNSVWYLVGSEESFKLYNREAGSSYAVKLASTGEGSAATMAAADEATSMQLAMLDNGSYTISPVGTPGQSFNMYGGKGNNIKLYNSTDGGSNWTLCKLNSNPLTIEYNAATEGAYPTNIKIADIGIKVGDATSSIGLTVTNIPENQELYLPVNSTFSVVPSFIYHGWKVDINGEESIEDATIEDEGLSATININVDTENHYQYLFYNRHSETGKPYRIPAIATAKDGTILAFSDYRPCSNDIGYGEVDIVLRRSSDNGKTWSEAVTIADGQGGDSNVFNVGFGDAAVVADRESGKVLVMAVAGKQVFAYATAASHNFMAKITSNDNGANWNAPEDVTAHFITGENALFPEAYSMFFGSGRIVQSKIVKTGSYYRLYGALLIKHPSSTYTGNCNFVVYSDDFGDTWKILGGSIDAGMCCNGGDEPKVEELADGSIVLSSRKYNGRYFNVFTFEDRNAGTGTWGQVVASNNVSGGISFGGNATNGEIYRLPAINNTTGAQCDIILQSIPTGSGRSNVAIYYKELTETNYTPTTFAQNWTKGIEVSPIGSAYSTMILQNDGRMGFLYEEHPGDNYSYCIVYVPLTIEDITNGAYSLDGIVLERYYRLQGYASGNYMSSSIYSGSQMAMVGDATGANTVFYVTANSKLLNYASGTFTKETHSIGAMGADNTDANAIEFRPSQSNNAGYYTLYTNYSGSKYIYDNSNRVDRNSGYAATHCEWKVIPVSVLPVTISTAKYASFYAPVAVTIPEGVKAYYLTEEGISENSVDMTPIEAGETIPANTGVILYGEAGTYNFIIGGKATADVTGNLFKGTAAKTVIANDAYILGIKDGAVGLYKTSEYENNRSFTNGSHKAYLPSSSATAALSVGFSFDFEGTTAIDKVESEDTTTEGIFDLMGRKVENPVQGIYIVNGRKVFIK